MALLHLSFLVVGSLIWASEGKISNFNDRNNSPDSAYFPIFNVDVDFNGQLILKKWSPSEKKANVGTDYNNNNQNRNKTFRNSILKPSKLTKARPENVKASFIDLNRNTSVTGAISATDVTEFVAELVIVCDKEFGDLFEQDNQRILDYWTVYMWDLNLRYKTLPSVSISFRVNGIIVISSLAAQPFIELARAGDSRVDFTRILGRYSTWLYSQGNVIPKHDLALLVTNAKLEWEGGLSIKNGACWVDTKTWRDLGIAVFNDGGYWATVTTAAQTLGYSLGAFNDDELNVPGGCDQRQFIMSRGNQDRRYFFSSCSDRFMNQFVRSDSALCLKQIDEVNPPALDPTYSTPKAPTMDEICKLGLGSDSAYVNGGDSYNCSLINCALPGDSTVHNIIPVENTICGGGTGRCFRGECRQQGYLFKNVASGLCLVATDKFEYYSLVHMVECPVEDTPLERFVVINGSTGIDLEAPYSFNGNNESGNKCLWTGNPGAGVIYYRIWTDTCNTENPWQGWELLDVDGSNFLLHHIVTGRCAVPESKDIGSYVSSNGTCDGGDVDMLWTKYL